MRYLTHIWLMILVMTLGVVFFPFEKSTAAESGGKSSVLYAIPRPPKMEKKQPPSAEPESAKPPLAQSVPETQAQLQEKEPAISDDLTTDDLTTDDLTTDDLSTDDLSGDSRPSYEPKSTLDPFVPLIQEPKSVPPEGLGPKKPQRVLTPLEKMTLSQIKLVAVVMGENLKIAMVQDATGKGYEVRIGTYMGKKGGQVVDIQSDRIIVREMVADFKGVVTERFEELKLHKADSGE